MSEHGASAYGTMGGLPPSALDERLAIVGTSGSGKTYAAKGWVERLLSDAARVCVVDPLGVWWGLRSGADGTSSGFSVVVFGGRHADIAINEAMGETLGRLIGISQIACVIDLSDLGSGAARRRFMAAFAEALYEANTQSLHLVLDEADLWAPQRPQPDGYTLLGRIEEIVRRGRVRGFVPWLITQRPAVVAKDVLSQADILVAMKLTSSQDRDAIGGWIEGQADRAEGKRILAELPRLGRGDGYLWAPGHNVLTRTTFPAIRTFDSSRTPSRGERIGSPQTLAPVDLSAITAALAAAKFGETPSAKAVDGALAVARAQLAERDTDLRAARDRILALEDLLNRIREIARTTDAPVAQQGSQPAKAAVIPIGAPKAVARPSTGVPPDMQSAARKLLAALAQHAPARFTWGQAATLAGLKPSGGHFNAGRKHLRDSSLVLEEADLVAASPAGMAAAGEVPPAPSTAAERLTLWCERLPSPAPEMLRYLAALGERYTDVAEVAQALNKKPTGGHWNSGIALLRNNGLIEADGKRLRAGELFR